MKKRNIVLLVSALAMVVFFVAAVVWSFPIWHHAFLLNRIAKSDSIGCQIQMMAGKESLSKEQEQFLQGLSWALGADPDAVLDWKANGRICKAQVYAEIFCAEFEEPITELYITKDEVFINVRMLYEAIQENIASEHPLFGSLLPEWKYGTCISLRQLEELFGVNLKEMFKQHDFAEIQQQNFWQYLILLTRMERHRTEDGNWQFETVWNDYQLVLRSDNKDQGAKIAVSGCVKQESQSITSFSTVLTSEERYPLKIPDSVMQEEEIEQFQMLWELVRNFTEGRTQD